MKYINYVNTKQGTASDRRFSVGNTLPLVQQPFGFAAFAPQTNSDSEPWFYHPSERSFEGFRLTHQLSPWIGEQAGFVLMPQSGKPETTPLMRWSGFRDMVLMPHYMSCFLTRARAEFSLTPTRSGACVRVRFENPENNYISVLPACGACRFEVRGDTVFGETDCNSWGGRTHKMYFVIRFCDKLDAVETDGALHIKMTEKCVEFNLASSFISCDQALVTLGRENVLGFCGQQKQNEEMWEKCLSTITFDGGDKRTFYSCMYRAFLFPHKAYEKDENGRIVHFNPDTGRVHEGYRYTDFEMWDAYRTNFPFLAIAAPEEYEKMIAGTVTEYLDCGWLPRLTAIEPKACMPSTMVDAVLCAAAKNGCLKGEMLRAAFEGMLKHSREDSPVPEHGRRGCSDYVRLGYVPGDKYAESVNLTVDASFGDLCIAELAKILGEDKIEAEYRKRAKNYANLFDSRTGFIRGKKADGSPTMSDFSPISWGGDYTEAAAWQTTFSPVHDLDGLAELFGGRDALIEKLDALFAAKPDYDVGGYGQEIHEMTEMAAADFGQCAISNQPSFHIPFIYAYFGETEKTDYWVRRICREGFSPDIFPGDEDTGSMACWYIFAMLGIYPLDAYSGKFVKFTPQLENAKINGKNPFELVPIINKQ